MIWRKSVARVLANLTAARSEQVISREHALGASQNRVLGGVVRVVFGWDLQNGWDRGGVRVNHVTDELSIVLIDENDVDVVALQETLEAVFQLADWCV